MQDKNLSYYKNFLTDIEKINRFAKNIFVICSLFYGILGYFIYDDVVMDEMWRPLFYYGFLVFPLLMMCVDYQDNKHSAEFRYTIFIPAIFFYTYILLLDIPFFYFVYALCAIGTSILYCDILFSRIVGAVLFILHIGTAIYLEVMGSTGDSLRIPQAFIVLVITFFFNLSLNLTVIIRDSQMEEVTQLSRRYNTLISVDRKKVFEYNIEKDEITLVESDREEFGQRKYYKNFSENAKKYRYVLYADWKDFDKYVQMCRNGIPEFEVEMRLRNRFGDYQWYVVNGKTIISEDGTPETVIGTIKNIDERKREELRKADERKRDPLTRLYRRFYARELMEEYLEKQAGEDYAGLIIIDIDNFRKLCESMGNAFADEILHNVAADLEDVFYPTDILGRSGSDEFIIMMKYIEQISDIEKKLDEVLESLRRTYSDNDLNFSSTVSIGVSVYPKDGQTYEELYKNALKSLAYAQDYGRDRYCFYDADKEEIYAQYRVDEKLSKWNLEDENEQMQGGAETESLFELATRLLEESKDTDSAINLLLRHVARELDVDGILIRRRIGKSREIYYPYFSLLLDVPLDQANTNYVFSEEEWENEITYIRKHNGLACCEDVEDLDNELIKAAAVENGLQSYARSSFFEKDEYLGSIDVVNFTRKREWTKEDRRTIQILTNVVSAYLFKMKAFEDARETVEHMTGYDSVTDLYKYDKFLVEAEKYLESAPYGQYAIVYLDFANFKYINEIYGYEIGDKILRAYADEARAYDDHFISGCRVFSDNMICLMNADGWTVSETKFRLERASNNFRLKTKRKYLESNLSCVFGVCLFTIDGNEFSLKNIISNANLARKEAKKPQNPPCVIYDTKMGEKLLQEITFANDMESAFFNREFAVYMQPKVDLKKSIISGAEALIRWIKPDGSMIFPNEFVPVFEKNKTITLLDYFVYDEVCKYLQERIRTGKRLINISMNVSRVHLNSIDQLINYIDQLLKKYEIPPYLLEFELTETVFTDTVEDTVELMNRLRELGVKVSMDDFGSGYSSLNVLTKLPLDVLKLDKEFLRDFENDPDEKIIIPGIIDMAKKMNLRVVCEGVETMEQVKFLRDVDCDVAQGFFYSKPMPLDVFSKMLEDDNFAINQEKIKR